MNKATRELVKALSPAKSKTAATPAAVKPKIAGLSPQDVLTIRAAVRDAAGYEQCSRSGKALLPIKSVLVAHCLERVSFKQEATICHFVAQEMSRLEHMGYLPFQWATRTEKDQRALLMGQYVPLPHHKID